MRSNGTAPVAEYPSKQDYALSASYAFLGTGFPSYRYTNVRRRSKHFGVLDPPLDFANGPFQSLYSGALPTTCPGFTDLPSKKEEALSRDRWTLFWPTSVWSERGTWYVLIPGRCIPFTQPSPLAIDNCHSIVPVVWGHDVGTTWAHTSCLPLL